MIYKESECSQYECRAPGAFTYEKPYERYSREFIFPRCIGSKCAHWKPLGELKFDGQCGLNSMST